MQSATRPLYSKHPNKNVEAGVVDVLTGKWVPTIVNPAESDPNGMEFGLFVGHIGIWLAALILASIANFGAGGFMKDDSNATDASSTADYPGGPTDTTVAVGIIGGIFSILGVVALLGFASIYTAEELKGMVWANAIIQFFTIYGTTASFFIFCQAAQNTETLMFWMSLFGAIFMLYAQTLLYCTSAALDTLALPRVFLPSLAASVQFISALSISGDEFKCWWNGAAVACNDNQKVLAWVVPATTTAALVIMVALRRMARDEDSELSSMKFKPFQRSLILFCFLSSGILSVYKLSFVQAAPDAIAFMFTYFGALLNMGILTIVFAPNSGASGGEVAAR